MKSLLELYGQQFRNPMLNSDSEDYTTADVFGQMGQNKRRSDYDNSLLGMVHNWATQEQRQPVQLPDDASSLDQLGEAGARIANLPMAMAAGGAKTMAHWMGAAANPEMVEPLDMLAPLGIWAIAGMAGAVPRGAVGSAGGKLRPKTYPKGLNPIHPVYDWDKVAGIVRALRRGDDVPPILYDGNLKNGNLLAGTHRAAANDVMEKHGRKERVDSVDLDTVVEVADSYGLTNRSVENLLNALKDGDFEVIDRIWDRRDKSLFADQSRASMPGLLAGAADEPTQDDELMRLMKLYGMMP